MKNISMTSENIGGKHLISYGVKKGFIFFSILALSFGPIHSASAAPKACDLNSQVEALAELKKNGDSSSSAIKSELAIRKDTLRNIIDCSVSEVKTLQGTVRELDSKDDLGAIKETFIRKLDDAIGFYETEKSKLDTLGLKGSKDMAKTIRVWRENNYAPLADETANLVLWVKNQPLFTAAESRAGQINATIRALKLLEEEDINKLSLAANENLEIAKKLNAEARTALLDELAPKEATAKLKGSLEALSKTYHSFMELGAAVKKLLPI